MLWFSILKKFCNVYDFYYFLSSLGLWKDHKNCKNHKKQIFAHNSLNNALIANPWKTLECLQFLLYFKLI